MDHGDIRDQPLPGRVLGRSRIQLVRRSVSGASINDERPPNGAASEQPRHDGQFSEMAAMTNTRKILIVDDDAELPDAMVEQLALHEEFESVAVDSGSKGVQAAKSGQVDLVIMDVGLPDLDGREAVRILRKNGFKAPIIMLTGHNTDSDTILGLESGANGYVAKPFRFAVLLARIRAQLRQHEASEDAVFTIGPYTFQPRSKILLNQKVTKSGSRKRKRRSCAISTAPVSARYRARRCCRKSGVTIPVSPRTRSRRTFICCGRSSRRPPPLPPSWSPRQATTSWCPNSKARCRRFGPSVTAKRVRIGHLIVAYGNARRSVDLSEQESAGWQMRLGVWRGGRKGTSTQKEAFLKN